MSDANTGQGQSAKKQISIAGLQQDLKDGLDRDQIAKKYEISKAEVSRIFQHPKLKGLKVRKGLTDVELIDDAPERKPYVPKQAKPIADASEQVADPAPQAQPQAEASPKAEAAPPAPAATTGTPETSNKKGVW